MCRHCRNIFGDAWMTAERFEGAFPSGEGLSRLARTTAALSQSPSQNDGSPYMRETAFQRRSESWDGTFGGIVVGQERFRLGLVLGPESVLGFGRFVGSEDGQFLSFQPCGQGATQIASHCDEADSKNQGDQLTSACETWTRIACWTGCCKVIFARYYKAKTHSLLMASITGSLILRPLGQAAIKATRAS